MTAATPPRPRAAHPVARPAAVVVDMDGLILDTEPLAARAWTEAATALGIEFDSAVTLRLVGRNIKDCAALIRAHHGDDYPVQALAGAWQGAYDAVVARDGLVLKPGLLELLEWLDEERIPKAVATSTRGARARAKLARTGIVDRFAAIVGGDEIARGKPAPDIYLEAALRLAVDATACIALEDSDPGMTAALDAGMTAIMVPDLAIPSPALLARQPLVLASLHHVRAHLAALPAAAPVR